MRSLGVVGIVLALLAALLGSSAAQAGPADQSRSSGQFLSGSLLSAIPVGAVAGLGGAQAQNLGSSTTVVNQAGLDLTALSLVGINVPGGIGLLPFNQLVQLGAVNQYAEASDLGISRSASGAVGNTGAVSVGGTNGFPASATLTLQPLLSAVPLASAALSDVRLSAQAVTGVAALTANSGSPAIDCANLSSPVHCRDYNIAGAQLVVRAPAVAGLTNTLVGPGGVASTVDTAVNTLTGPNGLLASALSALNSALAPLLGNTGLTIAITTNITGALNTFLDTPLTTPTSAVSINLRTGDITVDLDKLLTAANGKGLANLDPNTEILSATVLSTLVTQVTSLLNQVPTLVNTLLATTLNAANLTVTANLCLIGSGNPCTTSPVPILDIGVGVNVSVNGSLAQVIAGTAPASIGLKVGPLNPVIPVGTLLGALAGPITNVLFNPTTGVIATVTGSGSPLTGVVTGAINLLGPALGVLNNVVSLVGNVQESPSAGVYREVALRASLLNNAAARLDLGKAEVGANVAFAAPTATGVSPTNGPAGGGTVVTLAGTGFAPGATTVTIGGVTIPAGSVTVDPSGDSLTFTTPGGTPGPVSVTATTAAGTTGPQTFTYNALSAPVLLTPANGSSVTSPITFSGTSATAGTVTVSIAGSPICTSPVAGGTFSCQAALPPGTYTASATVTDAVGNVSPVSNSNTFTVILPTPAPTASNLTPNAGPTAGGQLVTVTGTNFVSGATSVTIGGITVPAGSVTVNSGTSLSFTTPAHAAGPVQVTVTTAGGTSAPLNYTYVPAPTADSLAPAFGPTTGGQTVTINGSGFVSGATTVTIDGLNAPGVVVNSGTQLTFVTPPHTAGPVPVTVTTPGGTAGPLTYTYLAAPTASSLTPNAGPTAGGQIVTVTGSGFVPGLTWVNVDGVQQPLIAVTVTSATTLIYVTPAHAAGPVPVSVTTLGGTSAPLTYKYVAAPTAASLSPDNGPLTGGTPVTVTGTNFAQAFTTVTVDGAPVAVTVNSATSLTFLTPIGDVTGPVDVIVSNAGQPAGALPFTYNAPVITAGDVFAGAASALTGSGWRPNDSVTVVLLDSSSTPVAGGTTTVTTTATGEFPVGTALPVPAGTPSGFYTAQATDTQGNVDTDALTVLFVLPLIPVITDINPPSGPLIGTNGVVINGANLNPTSFVYFGATIVTPTSFTATSVTFNVPPGTAPGPVSVSVQGGFGSSNQLTFTYLPPTAAATSPVVAGSSTQVSSSGWNALQSLSLQLNAPDGTDLGLPITTSTDVNGAIPGTVAVPVPAGSAAGTYSVEVSNGITTVAAPFQVLAVPTASDLDPDAGPISGGQLVTITGSGFVPGSEVVVDGTTVPAGAVTVVDPTTITYLTPAHPAGAVDVSVTNDGGTSAPLTYTYLDAPTASSLDPAYGPTAGGNAVTIIGAAFTAGSIVTVDGTPVPAGDVTFVSATELTYLAPAHPAGPVPVTVSTLGGTSAPLTYTYLDVPSAASLTPVFGPVAGGQTVTVTGTGFLAGVTDVVVDGLTVPAAVASSTELTYLTPAHAAGPVPVTVVTPGGTSAPALTYTYVDVPTTSDLDPDSGPVAGGQLVTVAGSGFVPGQTTVNVDGTSVPATVLTPTSLTYLTPAHPAGAVPVTVTTPGGTTAPLTYTYLDVPTAASLNPTSGPTAGGQTVTVTGSGFVAGDTDVVVDGIVVPATVVSATSLTYVTPAHAAGAVPVTVVTGGGTSTPPLTYTYLNAPFLSTISPTSGPVSGGQLVSITGGNFVPGSTVSVDGISVPANLINSTWLTYITPAHAAGPVPVTVVTPGGVSNPLGYTYVDAPTALSLNPTSGPVAGGNTVTVTGTNFVSGTSVLVDGAPVPATVLTSTTLTYVAPAHAAGPVPVVVVTAGGTSAPLTYTYVDAPVASDLDPANGPLTGGTVVTVNGSGFIPTTTVTVDGAAVPATIVSDTELTFVTPVGTTAGDPVEVVVANLGQEAAPLLFTYDDPDVVAQDTQPGVAAPITGSGWRPSESVTVELLDADLEPVPGTQGIVSTWIDGSLNPGSSVPVPASVPEGPYYVLATDSQGNFATDDLVVSANPGAPFLVEISPDSGPLAGGGPAIIFGFDIDPAATVTFDGVEVEFVWTPLFLITVVPAGTVPGPVDVVVSNGPGLDSTLVYTYDPPVATASGPVVAGDATDVETSGWVGDSTLTLQLLDPAGNPVGAPVDAVTDSSGSVSDVPVPVPVPADAANGTWTVTISDGLTTIEADFQVIGIPTAASLTPNAGPTAGGQLVTITGTNFAGVTLTVTVDGISVPAGDVAVVNNTTLTYLTPEHLVPGPVDVTVTTPGGTTAPLLYTYLAAPTVATINPNQGPSAGGQLVTVTGTGFVGPFTSVIVDGTLVPADDVTIVSETELTYVSPAHPAGAIFVSVTNPGGTSGPLSYTYLDTPTTVSLTPPNGPLTGGTAVTVEGTGFLAGTTTVSVGGLPVGITVNSDTSLTFTTPVGLLAGPVDVVVANGTEVADPLPFTYDLPVITAGDTIVGTPSILTGSDWRPNDTVLVVLQFPGGNPVAGADPTILTTTATGAFPLGAVLSVPNTVVPGDYIATATDSQGNTVSGPFVVSPIPPETPVLTTITPNSGPLAGTPGVVITGEDFEPGAVVIVDGVEVVPTSITPTTITVDIPEGVEPGQVEVVVSNGPEADSAPLPFVYLPPTASTTSPVVAGNATLTSTSGWQGDTALTFQLISPLGDPVGAAVPATTDATGAVDGTVAVVVPVSSPSGVYGVAVSNGVTEIEVPFDVYTVPTTADLDPDSGPVAGGQTVTVTGSGFTGPGYETGDVEVVVDGTVVPAVDVTVLSDTQLTYLTPAHAAGVEDVVVTTPGGESDPLDYTYIGTPTAESLDPSSGPLTGGTTVTVTGGGFVDAVTTVWVDGVEVPATVVSSTELTIITPPGILAGPVEVVVANGELLSEPLEFTYDAPAVQATDGVPGGTTEVTGDGWRPVDEITIQLFDGATPIGSPIVVVTDEDGTIPAGTLLPIPVGTEPGAYTVVAVDSEGNEAATGIAVTPYDGPVLTGLDPANGPLSGGTEVTATGTGFLPGTVVIFDGVEIIPVSISEDGTTLVFIVPPGAVAGPVDVQIVSGGQPSNPLPYTYDAPTVDVGGPNVPGGEIPVTGECWPVGAVVTVQLKDPAGNPVGSPVQVVVGPDCTFTVKLPVPTDAVPGLYSVDVTDDLGNSATSRLSIVQPALQIVAPVQVFGVDVSNTVIGTDWEPGVPVALEVRSDPIALGSQIPGPDGRFSLQFSTSGLEIGRHAVWATQVRSDGVIVTRTVVFEIVPAPHGGGGHGGGGLPNTGVPVTPMLSWAALLLLLGAALVLTPRLRERFSVR